MSQQQDAPSSGATDPIGSRVDGAPGPGSHVPGTLDRADRRRQGHPAQGAAVYGDEPGDRATTSRRDRWVRLVAIGVVLVVAALLFMARRPDELASPYLWDEEGAVISRWLWHGWHTAFQPINGDLSVLTTGSIVLAGWVGWPVLPTIAYALAVGAFVATAGLLLVPRSSLGPLPVRAAMVIFLAVVPVNPEVYGILLYSFWWTSLWPVIALGWSGRPTWWRPLVVGLAGINSLAAAVLAVVYLPWALRRRSRELAVSGAILLVELGAQLYVYFSSDRGAATAVRPLAVLEQTGINMSQLVVHPWLDPHPVSVGLDAAIGGVLILCLLGAVLLLKEASARETGVVLWAAAVVLSGLSAAPVPLLTHPVLAGPRYYFLPFALFGILLIFIIGQVAVSAPTGSRAALAAGGLACAMLALALSRLAEPGVFVRHSEHLDWQAARQLCASSPSEQVLVPIQFDGVAAHAWKVPFPSARCRMLDSR